jgi:DNA-binding response OmpR family regulator
MPRGDVAAPSVSLLIRIFVLSIFLLSSMPHILIIEDDPELGPRLQYNFDLEGYRVTLAAALHGDADLIVLDLMLPLIDGMTVLRQIRSLAVGTPVIILTAKGAEHDRLDGFRAGCDDYVPKPFSLKELISRVKAVLRRSGYRERPSVIHADGLMIDPHARSASLDGEFLPLAPKEFDLLYLLASHPHQALSRSFLLDEVWGEDCDVTTRTVDNHVAGLRKKIEQDPDTPIRITTVYKVGYRWEH